jgi:hypothetical protein
MACTMPRASLAGVATAWLRSVAAWSGAALESKPMMAKARPEIWILVFMICLLDMRADVRYTRKELLNR